MKRHPPAPPHKKLTKAQRRALYNAAKGNNEFPICPYCRNPVLPAHAWDGSHEGAPHALGGKTLGVWHRRCNSEHGAKVVTPMVAKTWRIYEKNRGIHVSRRPFRSKERPWKRTIGGLVVDRRTGELWSGRGRH
jgi:hypothetical protein